MDDPEMVPKSDLIAVKESGVKALEDLGKTHTAEIERIAGEHATAASGLQSKLSTSEEELSRLRATITQNEEVIKNHTATGEELKTAKSELKTAKDDLKALQDSQSEDLRGMLTSEFKIAKEALEGKTLGELKTIRDALASTRGPNSNQYTHGGGAGGDPPTTGRQKIKAGLEGGELKSE